MKNINFEKEVIDFICAIGASIKIKDKNKALKIIESICNQKADLITNEAYRLMKNEYQEINTSKVKICIRIIDS